MKKKRPPLTAAQQALVVEALPRARELARTCLRWFPGGREELDALTQEALVIAAPNYDPNNPKRTPFPNYAYKAIRGSLVEMTKREIRHRDLQIQLGDLGIECPLESEGGLDDALMDTPSAARERAVVWARGESSRLAAAVLIGQGPKGARRADEQLIVREARQRCRAVVMAAVAEMPADQQRVVKMRLRDRLPAAQVAAELGCCERTVRRLGERAKAALVAAFEAAGIDAPPPSGPPSSARPSAQSMGEWLR